MVVGCVFVCVGVCVCVYVCVCVCVFFRWYCRCGSISKDSSDARQHATRWATTAFSDAPHIYNPEHDGSPVDNRPHVPPNPATLG